MSEHHFPPPPPVGEPVEGSTDGGGGSFGWGLVLGLGGAVVASFSPILLSRFSEGSTVGGLLLLPLLLVVAIVLAVRRSTRRTGVGMLVGFAVGVVASAGTCIYWLNKAY